MLVRDDFVAGFRAITLPPYNSDRRPSPSRQVGETAKADKCGNGKRRVISGKKQKFTEIQLIRQKVREIFELEDAIMFADIARPKLL